MPPEEFEEVLHFWFPRYLSDDHAAMVRQFEWWFRGGADSAIAERFAPPPERATRGELVRWTRGRAVSGQNTHFQSLQELLAFIAQTLQQNQRTGNTWLLQVEVPQVYPPCHSILSDTQVFLKALPLYLVVPEKVDFG